MLALVLSTVAALQPGPVVHSQKGAVQGFILNGTYIHCSLSSPHTIIGLCIYLQPFLYPLYETYFNNFILTLLICLQVLRPFVGFHTPRHRLERIDSDRPYHRFHGLAPLIHLTSVSSMLILFYVFQRQPNHPISTVLYLPTSPVLQPSNAGF